MKEGTMKRGKWKVEARVMKEGIRIVGGKVQYPPAGCE